MKHTSEPHFSGLRAATMAFLLTGTALITAASGQLGLAQLSGGGLTLLASNTKPILNPDVLSTLQSAAPDMGLMSQLQGQMLIGMVMVLAGFACHLAFIRRHRKSPAQASVSTKTLVSMK